MGEISKWRSGCQYKNREISTPGSGEALLRNQVMKILLQKVEEEEEAELSKISMSEKEKEIVIAMDKGGEGIGSKKDLMITRSLLPEFLDEPAEDHDGSPDKGDDKNNQEEEEEEGKDGYDDSEMVNEFYEYFIKKMNVSEGGGEKTSKEEEEKRLKGLPTSSKGKHLRFPEEE